MTNLILSTLVPFMVSASADAPTSALATHAQQVLEHTVGRDSKDWIGVESSPGHLVVYVMQTNNLVAIPYACTPDGCQAGDATVVQLNFNQADQNISAAGTRALLAAFEDAFQQEFGDLSQIQKLKFWQFGSSLEFRVSRDNTTDIFFYCHPHGDHLDCHDKSRPGRFEP